MAHLGEFLRGLGADLSGQALRRPKLGKARLERLVALAQRVVFRVRDRRRVLLVIAPVVLGDLAAERVVLGAGLVRARALGSVLGRSLEGMATAARRRTIAKANGAWRGANAQIPSSGGDLCETRRGLRAWASPKNGRVGGTVGRAESTPGARPRRTPGLAKGEEGTPKWILRVGRPVASPRFSRPGLIGRDASSRLDHRSSGPSAGSPLSGAAFGVPSLSALWARPARSGRGADVFGLSRPALDGAFREGALQSRRPPESDATERPPRDRLPSACMTRCARGSSPEGSAGR